MAHFLVIRLSAIGDVAMTIPVVYSAARTNPQHRFTVLTQAFLMPLFMNRPENVEVVGINTKTTEKRLGGLLRFCSVLLHTPYDAVLDLHHVLRTMVISNLFRLKGTKVYVVDKARIERHQLVQESEWPKKPLRPVVKRYEDVFRQGGLAYQESFTSLFPEKAPCEVARRALSAELSLDGAERKRWIGVAPFAKHRGKIYPPERMEQVIARLAARPDTQVYLFGGRGAEEETLRRWAAPYINVSCVAGRFRLDQELRLIHQLDLLICMDSANMHFASLVGTRVLSIWGATHPYAGFYGYRQEIDYAVQLPLRCRPCSIYGQKPCRRGDWACMTQLPPEDILNKVEYILGN